MLDHLKDHLPLLQYAHLLWGFALFCCLALWVYWPSRKRTMQDHATRILGDDAVPLTTHTHKHTAPRGNHGR